MFPIDQLLEKNLKPQDQGIFLTAKWSAPAHVKTLITTRKGGVSSSPFNTMNLGNHVGDLAEHVTQNRVLVQEYIGIDVCYLKQTHSTIVVNAVDALGQNWEADASIDRTGKVACGVMTADCLPVLLTDRAGSVVAAVHAGWRGLANGVLLKAIEEMNIPSEDLLVYFGPAIGPDAFEVGEDVKEIFCQKNTDASLYFHPINEQQYLADIYGLAQQQLNQIGITKISGGEYCTVLEREQFFSYRRDGQTGRMLSAIWIDQSAK